MSALPLAHGAEPILRARLKGKRPADMVLIVLGASVQTDNPVVYAQCDERYDWRWVRGLDVCVYLTNDDDWPGIVTEIARCWPAHVELWNRVDQWGAHAYLAPTPDTVDKPRPMWKFDLDFLPWMAFQNDDFIAGRRYARDQQGVPYAIGE
jgi:hypothetical protein